MQEQFLCNVLVDLPVEDVETGQRVYFSIASFGFDPGFQAGDEITVNDAGFVYVTKQTATGQERTRGRIPRFNFRAKVLKRERVIDVDVETNNGIASRYTLLIYLEIADKEQIPEIVQAVTRNFPVYRSALPED